VRLLNLVSSQRGQVQTKSVSKKFASGRASVSDNEVDMKLQQFPVDLNQDGFRGPGEALWH
jgi:hypothetical protein